MSWTDYDKDGDYIAEKVHTDKQTATITGHIPYKWLRVAVDGSTATVSVISGLDMLANDRETTLSWDGTATVRIDDETQQVEISDGTATADVSGASTVQAVDLEGVPAKSSETVTL